MKQAKYAVVALLAAGACSGPMSSVPATTTASSPIIDQRELPERLTADDLVEPTVRYRALISNHADGQAAAELRLCVRPSGDVAEVAVVQSSGFQEYDRALARRAAGWKYAAFDASSSNVRVCSNVKVVYREL